jgi:hypothetical protein
VYRELYEKLISSFCLIMSHLFPSLHSHYKSRRLSETPFHESPQIFGKEGDMKCYLAPALISAMLLKLYLPPEDCHDTDITGHVNEIHCGFQNQEKL